MAKKNNVTVISIDGISRDYKIETVDNHKLIRGYVKDLAIRKKVQKSIKEGKVIKKTIYSFVYNYYRAKSYVKALISKQNTDIQKIKAFDKILETQEIDVLIPVCIPFEAVLSSVKFKKKHTKVKLIPILFDRFTYNESLHRNKINMLIKEKKHKSLEQEMVLYSDKIYSMKQLKRTFKNMFPDEINRFRFIEHPLLKKIHLPICNEKGSRISIIYAGALYKEFRSPKFVLDIFSKMGQEFELNFYSSGDCEDIINQYSQQTNSVFKQYGYVEIEDLKNAYSCADIFLSIGNKNMENVTSKIFEYISIGKPIIHFYYNDDDPTLDLLRGYPLAICFKQDYSIINNLINDVRDFCMESYKKNIKFGEISNLYKDANPTYIVDMIESDINDQSGRGKENIT
jgi:glycosyltransferase involved in cell wall biosynthesis